MLRKVSPLEADLLRDPVIQARVRFRYGELEGLGFVVVAFYIFFQLYVKNNPRKKRSIMNSI